MSVSTASQGSKEKSRAPKAKAIVAASLSNNQNSVPARLNASADTAGEEPPNTNAQDGKNAPRSVYLTNRLGILHLQHKSHLYSTVIIIFWECVRGGGKGTVFINSVFQHNII